MKGKEFWEAWLEDAGKRDRDFQRYSQKRKIRAEEQTRELVLGHRKQPRPVGWGF